MHIFIDESGTFSGYHPGSVAVVGALVIPDRKLPYLQRAFDKLRRRFPLEKGAIKGRLLSETQVNDVVSALQRADVLLELTVVDMGAHALDRVLSYQQGHIEGMRNRARLFNPLAQIELRTSLDQIAATPPNLYLQALSTFTVLENVVQHAPLYYVQRYPKELGNFAWIVDGKDPTRVTDYETWWSWSAGPILARRSKRQPMAMLIGANYAYFDKYRSADDDGEDATNMRPLFKDLRFSSDDLPGLEAVDVVVNAVRRGLMERLSVEGWGEIPTLMVHRVGCYVTLPKFDLQGGDEEVDERYLPFLRAFRTNGKSMLAARR